MKLIPEPVEKWAAAQNPLKMIIGAGVFLCLIALWGSRVDWLKSRFSELIRAGTSVNPSGQVDVSTWLFILSASSIVLILTVGALIGRGVRKAEMGANARGLDLVQTFVGAAGIIKDRSFPRADEVPYALKSVKSTHYIHQNFSGEVVRRQIVAALNEPVDFFPLEIGVSGEAEAIDYLDGLELKVSDDSGHEVVALPTFLDKYRKEFLLVFLPKIEPGQERKLVIRYRWQGMWNELKSKRQEVFEWTFKSKQPIPLLELAVHFEPGMDISCDPLSKYIDARVDPAQDEEHKWFGVKYVVPNGPKGISSYKLLVKLNNLPKGQGSANSS